VAADVNDRPVGFALADEIGGNAHLDELDVCPAHGQRGLGTALVEVVCHWAKASGYRAITLTTLRHIPWNAPWYQRLGFRVLEEHELSAALHQLLQEEIQRGLPADQRVAMRRRCKRRTLAMPFSSLKTAHYQHRKPAGLPAGF
jgi:ribosomal protein S18 acetylase RimI-like enzyme